MASSASGSLNTKSFSASLQYGILPTKNSITYQGIINSLLYNVKNSDSNEILDIESNFIDWFNPINNHSEKFCSLLIKTKFDGIGYRRPIDLVFVLDKSGSMSSKLGENKNSFKSCIDLAKTAFIELIENLNLDDRISLIAVDNKAYTILSLTSKQNIKEGNMKEFNSEKSLFEAIKNIDADNGTDLCEGFREALLQFNMEETNLEYANREKRIIYTTDMNDIKDSLFEEYIQKVL